MNSIDNWKDAARRWLRALRAGDADAEVRFRIAHPQAPREPTLRDVQHALAREQGHPNWLGLRAHLEAPDLRRLERLAEDILRVCDAGDADSMARVNRQLPQPATVESLRADVRTALERAGALHAGEPLTRDVVRLLIARHAWFESWAELTEALRTAGAGGLTGATPPPDSGDAMQPVELRATFPMELQDGLYSTTTEVWRMLSATRAGDLDTVRSIVDTNPAMARCEHNYLPPLQMAVRERHTGIVAYLLEHDAYDPKFETYPYRESIHQVAADRGTPEIAALLEQHRITSRPQGKRAHGPGHIEFSSDPRHADRIKLEKLINADALHAVAAMVEANPNLIHDPLLFWGEGILAAPANSRQHKMIDLLLDLGARVPDVAKWAPYYYFKHLDVARRLLEAGMSARHMNWHRTTLLHHMAWEGNIAKAMLLLDHGADINAIDDEFRRTPLGLAVKAGREDMVRFLRERGGV